jgi:hypothetical protein
VRATQTPTLVNSLFLRIFTSAGLGLLITHSYTSFLIIIKLVYVIYIPTLFFPSPSSSSSMRRTLESIPTSIYGVISSASKRKGDLGVQNSRRSISASLGSHESAVSEYPSEHLNEGLVPQMVLRAVGAGTIGGM